MFTAYFDESGSPEDSLGALTLAGGVSTIQTSFTTWPATPPDEPVLRDLRARLEKWMMDTGDFMRGAKGFVS